MGRGAPSLRRRVAAIGVTTSAIALVVCGALVVWTTMMHRSTVTIVAAMERVRVVEASEISLLLHGTTTEPLVRQRLEAELTGQLAAVRRIAVTDNEEQLIHEVESAVTAYLTSPPDQIAQRRTAAYVALESLVDANVRNAQLAKDRVDRWNEVGDVVAMSVAATLLILTGGFLLWLKRRAFQPVFSLAEVMHRFGRGEREARAGNLGYDELEVMGERFNEMANALAAQRDGQIAFLGGVAHDLRGPLGALTMALEMLRSERESVDLREKRAFEIADRQILRLERMIGDFLDTAKIDSGSLELRWQTADLACIVVDVVEPMRASAAGHEIDCVIPQGPVSLRCDPVRLEQVVSNLVSNAIKYSPAGGTVRIELAVEGSEVCLAVTDAGIGIAPEDQARLFEPFQRVGDTKRAIAGVGLGLFIVRRIVEAHGGRIELTSTPGKGSTFVVHVPREAMAACA